MCYRTTISDPRDPSGDHRLDIVYEARRGAPPFEYEPEYRIDEALNKRGRCVLPHLTAAQYAALEDAVHHRHRFDF